MQSIILQELFKHSIKVFIAKVFIVDIFLNENRPKGIVKNIKNTK